MWILTKVKEQHGATEPMVVFDALCDDGSHWEAPLLFVKLSLGVKDVASGLRVRLQVGKNTAVNKIEFQDGAAPVKPVPPEKPGLERTTKQSRHKSVKGVHMPNHANKRLPYGFVPIDIDKAVRDTPVWHDGTTSEDLLSGEILCTLEALTPTLPGNARYSLKTGGVSAETLRRWGFPELDPANQPDKQIAEPLLLVDDSGKKVVIAGSALKGMIRHSLGALLSAPMERVAEHHYTYRPNLDFNTGVKERFCVRPALLVKQHSDGGWDIEVFKNARDALFLRREVDEINDAEAIVKNAAVVGIVSGPVRDVSIEMRNRRQTNHLIRGGSEDLNHRLASYKGGIDGEGYLAAVFKKRDHETPFKEQNDDQFVLKTAANGHGNPILRGPFTYRWALVPRESGIALHISADLYERYREDQEKVLANEQTGHLTAHPMDINTKEVRQAIKNEAEFVKGQLIYVEVSTIGGEVTTESRVESCGHHFRYRWAYTSSVRIQDGKPRECLYPLASEQTPSGSGPDTSPQKLTGARSLFGYVRDDKTNPIGGGVYTRLAGRIAINHAISDGEPDFLQSEGKNGYCVPLKILGQPKPSAWEFYLQQPTTGKIQTYGDRPDDSGGELGGRKFYRHFPGCDIVHIQDLDTVTSKQATLARFICATGTKFKFAIRFQDLRSWELGALLAVLEPERLAGDKEKTYAHKLGLGRPLGMGSVKVCVDKLKLRASSSAQSVQQSEGTAVSEAALESRLAAQTVLELFDAARKDEKIDEYVKAIRDKLDVEQIGPWLEAHDFAECLNLAYPTAQPRGKPKPIIYAWHTNLRKEYSKVRRQEGGDLIWTGLHTTIRGADPSE